MLVDGDQIVLVAPAPGAVRGFDGGQKTVARKRHIVVDTGGRLLMMNLTPAGISDSADAQAILDAIRKQWPWMKHLFADGAYARDYEARIDVSEAMSKLRNALGRIGPWTIELIKRSDPAKGFEVLPRRWVVEEGLAWPRRCRRFAKDWETSPGARKAG